MVSDMNAAIEYIETHLLDDVELHKVARVACCSMHQFGRVFSYLTGVSISEYIRRRRLSLAALELLNGGEKVIDIALKHGYLSPDAFTRAFQAMHGVTPTDVRKAEATLKNYPRISFNLSMKGDYTMDYRIIKKEAIQMVGVVRTARGKSSDTILNETTGENAISWKEANKEVWAIWDEFLNGEMNERIRDEYKLYRKPLWQIGFTQMLQNGEQIIAIGAESDGKEYPNLDRFTIPANTWAVFPARGTLNQTAHPIAQTWAKITMEWIPESRYEQIIDYDMQVYPPGDTNRDDYVCEIWVPVRMK
jgi:AraC family transcriptional regulator